MGIKGIVKYCSDHAAALNETVDLVEIARQWGGLKLLVDSNGFVIYLMGKLHTSVCSDSGRNAPHIAAIGGEYALLKSYLTRFVKVLSDANIELVWFFDGAKGSRASELEHRVETWISRRVRARKIAKNVVQAYNDGKEKLRDQTLTSSDQYQDEIKTSLFRVEYRELLRELYGGEVVDGCRLLGSMHQCVYGEADLEIASRFSNSCGGKSSAGQPFAIVSNNVDFALLKNCQWIPVHTFGEPYFDIDDHLQLSSGTPFKTAVESGGLARLRCRVLNAERFRLHLQLPDYDSVADFAFTCGNTFSYALINRPGEEWREDKLTLIQSGPRNWVETSARFVRQHKNLLDFHEVKLKMTRNSGILQSIERCRKYFNLERTSSDEIERTAGRNNEVVKILEKHISNFDYAPDLMAIYNRFFWRIVSLERIALMQTSTSELLLPLRKIVYHLLTPREAPKTLVIEFGINEQIGILEKKAQSKATFRDFSDLDFLPYFTSFVNTEANDKLNWFGRILMHAERSHLVFPKYFVICKSSKLGFTCYLLRYLFNLFWRRHLHITAVQFIAVCCSVLAEKTKQDDNEPDVDILWYCNLTVIPDDRCLSLMSSLQDIYWHTAVLLGSSLFVAHLLPKPSELFSGSLFSAFYVASEFATSSSPDLFRIENYESVGPRIRKDLKKVLKKNLPLINLIVNEDFDAAETLRNMMKPVGP